MCLSFPTSVGLFLSCRDRVKLKMLFSVVLGGGRTVSMWSCVSNCRLRKKPTEHIKFLPGDLLFALVLKSSFSLSVLSDYCFIPRSFSAHCCPSVPLSLVPMWTTAKSSHFLWGRPHIVRGENQHATPTYFVSDSKIFHILSLLIG